jgi:hydrogenase maturation protease
MPSPLIAPDLVFGYGNPGRGDDALGPLFIECLRELPQFRSGALDLLTDFQLQPEHALDLRGRRRVLFVDASANCAERFELRMLFPAPDASVLSHALEPGALLTVYERIERALPPPAWVLGIRGYAFELGEPLSARARGNLEAAVRWARVWLAPCRARRPVARNALEVELQ